MWCSTEAEAMMHCSHIRKEKYQINCFKIQKNVCEIWTFSPWPTNSSATSRISLRTMFASSHTFSTSAQTKYGLSYWKLSGNEKFAPSNYRALTRPPSPHSTPPYWGGYKHKKWGWPRISKFGFSDLYECSELTLGHIWHSPSLAGGLSPLWGVNKGDQEFKYTIFTIYMSI